MIKKLIRVGITLFLQVLWYNKNYLGNHTTPLFSYKDRYQYLIQIRSREETIVINGRRSMVCSK